jgi:hypothetical protein
METDLEFILEGRLMVAYWHQTHDRNDPKRFFDSLPLETKLSLVGTIQSFADTGQFPGSASGHAEKWYHEAPPQGHPTVGLFKFKDDPCLRFYSVTYAAELEKRLVLVYGFQDPKHGRERDRKTPTGRVTKKAEGITLNFILSLRPQ